MVNYLENLLGISLWIISIFFRSSQGELSRYFVSSRVNYLDLFEELHCELSRYIVGRLMVNYLDNLLGISLRIISIFCRSSQGELSRYFVRKFTVNYLDILWENSLWIISIFCEEIHCELSWYFVRNFTVNYPDILWGISLWIISIYCRSSHGELSR